MHTKPRVKSTSFPDQFCCFRFVLVEWDDSFTAWYCPVLYRCCCASVWWPVCQTQIVLYVGKWSISVTGHSDNVYFICHKRQQVSLDQGLIWKEDWCVTTSEMTSLFCPLLWQRVQDHSSHWTWSSPYYWLAKQDVSLNSALEKYLCFWPAAVQCEKICFQHLHDDKLLDKHGVLECWLNMELGSGWAVMVISFVLSVLSQSDTLSHTALQHTTQDTTQEKFVRICVDVM